MNVTRPAAPSRHAPRALRARSSARSPRPWRRPRPWRGPVAALALAAIAALLSACGPAFKTVSVKDLAAASQQGTLVLDVRERWEYDEGHVAGATLLPLSELPSRLAEVPADQPVYVYCHSGNRSRQASEILAKAGKKRILNVDGGILAWEAAGYPITRD